MKKEKKEENICGCILVALLYIVVIYTLIAGLYFRFSDPTNTETEILIEIITFGGYER